jgi:hypothetical protein
LRYFAYLSSLPLRHTSVHHQVFCIKNKVKNISLLQQRGSNPNCKQLNVHNLSNRSDLTELHGSLLAQNPSREADQENKLENFITVTKPDTGASHFNLLIS